jgi:hypothetical protein
LVILRAVKFLTLHLVSNLSPPSASWVYPNSKVNFGDGSGMR